MIDAKVFGEELAVIVKAEIAKATRPLNAQIKALETEVRQGNERLKALEGKR
ncbi:hypothetical protein I5535_11405 [Rhodobacteraceae bacterium F11138]|nr:hypothetical protein [Rhodobacteraceae bacterium F11138]